MRLALFRSNSIGTCQYLRAWHIAIVIMAAASTTMMDRSDHLVESLPFLSTPLSTRQYAGHLPVDDSGDRQLFYWLFAPSEHEDTAAAPLVVWLNGGPYYSSMVGLFLENGPFRIVNRTTIQLNPHSWHTTPAWMVRFHMLIVTCFVGVASCYCFLTHLTHCMVSKALCRPTSGNRLELCRRRKILYR